MTVPNYFSLTHNIKRSTQQVYSFGPVVTVRGRVQQGKTAITDALEFAITQRIQGTRFASQLLAYRSPATRPDEPMVASLSCSRPPETFSGPEIQTRQLTPPDWTISSYLDRLPAQGGGADKWKVSQIVTEWCPQLSILRPARKPESAMLGSTAPVIAREVLARFGSLDDMMTVQPWQGGLLQQVGIPTDQSMGGKLYGVKVSDVLAGLGKVGVRLRLLRELTRAPKTAEGPDAGPTDMEESDESVDPNESMFADNDENEDSSGRPTTSNPVELLQAYADHRLTVTEVIAEMCQYADRTRHQRAATSAKDEKMLTEAQKLLKRLLTDAVDPEREGSAGWKALQAMNAWAARAGLQCRLNEDLQFEVWSKSRQHWANKLTASGFERTQFGLAQRLAWTSMGTIIAVDDTELGSIQTDKARAAEWTSAFAFAAREAGALCVLFNGLRDDVGVAGATDLEA